MHVPWRGCVAALYTGGWCYVSDVGRDEVYGDEEEEVTSMCTYLLVDSRDKLLLNLTPQAMGMVKEVVDVS